MNKPQPIVITHLFPEILGHLLSLLSGLSADEWAQLTTCAGWSVKDVALHLLGVEVGILSRKRDGFSLPAKPIQDRDSLVTLVNDMNETWVQAARRLSPHLLCDLLGHVGRQVCQYLEALDPFALGSPVSWAGPDPAPVWLDLAREYTERWHHQQHIRDAVGRPGLTEPKYLAPVLDAFVRALPHTYQDVEAADGTLVVLAIRGNAGGRWSLLRENGSWGLYLDAAQKPTATVTLDEDDAWRLFTKGLDRDTALARATVSGDQSLALRALDMVSIIA